MTEAKQVQKSRFSRRTLSILKDIGWFPGRFDCPQFDDAGAEAIGLSKHAVQFLHEFGDLTVFDPPSGWWGSFEVAHWLSIDSLERLTCETLAGELPYLNWKYRELIHECGPLSQVAWDCQGDRTWFIDASGRILAYAGSWDTAVWLVGSSVDEALETVCSPKRCRVLTRLPLQDKLQWTVDESSVGAKLVKASDVATVGKVHNFTLEIDALDCRGVLGAIAGLAKDDDALEHLAEGLRVAFRHHSLATRQQLLALESRLACNFSPFEWVSRLFKRKTQPRYLWTTVTEVESLWGGRMIRIKGHVSETKSA